MKEFLYIKFLEEVGISATELFRVGVYGILQQYELWLEEQGHIRDETMFVPKEEFDSEKDI